MTFATIRVGITMIIPALFVFVSIVLITLSKVLSLCILVTIISRWYAEIHTDPVFHIVYDDSIIGFSAHVLGAALGTPQMTRQDT